MRKIWKEFKSFAMSGSMLDLALGFIIGTAFASVVTSLSDNVIMRLIAALFGRATFNSLHVTINGATVAYGAFLTDLLNFMLFALILFGILKMITVIGLGRARVFEEKQCPYCLEYIHPNALVCRVCREPLVATLPDLATAEARAAKLRARRHLNLPELPDFELPEMVLARARRKPAGTKGATTVPAAAPEHAHAPTPPAGDSHR